MKVKFLKIFRKRFDVVYNEKEFFQYTLLDHKKKKSYPYSTFSLAVTYSAIEAGYFNLWRRRIATIKERKERDRYYKKRRQEQ